MVQAKACASLLLPREGSRLAMPSPRMAKPATPKAKRPTAPHPTRLPPASALPPSKVVVPVRYAAWLGGDLGRSLERILQTSLDALREVKVSRLPRGFLVEADEEPGVLLEAVRRATVDLEASAAATYPVFHHELGPLWAGTLQAVFPGAVSAL